MTNYLRIVSAIVSNGTGFSQSVSEHAMARQTNDAFWNGVKQLTFLKFMLHDSPLFIQDIRENDDRIEQMLESKIHKLVDKNARIKSSGTMPVGKVRLPKKDAEVIKGHANTRKEVMADPNWNRAGKMLGFETTYPNRAPYPDNIEKKVV